MIGPLAIPLSLLLSLAAPDAESVPPVRLAPVVCGALADGELRAALKVELRDRLLADSARPPEDFVLVSVACAKESIDLLLVRQRAGSPARRNVPVAGLAAEARPRAVAVAIAELLRVDLARNLAPPVAGPSPAQAPPRATTVGVSGTPFMAGGYLSGANKRWINGSQLRVALESRPPDASPRRWGWGLAYELTLVAPDSRIDLMNGLLVLARWQGGQLVPEIGLGARLGPSSGYSLSAVPGSHLIGGPYASLAIEVFNTPRCFERLAAEGGFDFGAVGGGWIAGLIGAGCRF